MSFAVLRTLSYSKAGFDTLKQTAITQLGAGRNAKLNLQFNSRPWNTLGSTGSLYFDQGLEQALPGKISRSVWPGPENARPADRNVILPVPRRRSAPGMSWCRTDVAW
jgi:hypothetical protein